MNFRAIDRRTEGTTLLRQCQLAELYLFDVFCEICKEYNLTYFIYGGTLLGAARHKGFIPWDDDIDVAMPKQDYLKFLKIAPSVMPDGILLTPSKECKNRYAFAKMIDRSSLFVDIVTNVQNPCGIYIDIFPYEKVAKLPLQLSGRLAKWCYQPYIETYNHIYMLHTSISGLFSSGIRAMVWRALAISAYCLQVVLRYVTKTVWRCSPNVPLFQPHVGFEHNEIFPLREIEFEGRKCLAPNNIDSYLTKYYGDWRTLPPPEKRVWHSSIICPTQAPDAPWARKYQPPAQ